MTSLALAALVGLLIGWVLPPPWHRRSRAKARARGRAAAHEELAVPTEADITAALAKAKKDHAAHELDHHTDYPRHVAEEAIRQRARNELAAAGFRFVPIDLHARVKKAR